jgi:hypothetical protein
VLRGVRSSALVLLALLVLRPAIASADALPDDATPPEVEIIAPGKHTQLPAGTTKVTIEVRAEDEETGVVEVRLLVDGELVRTVDEEPWVAELELSVGTHEIVAETMNHDSDEGTSSPITVVVAAAAPPPEVKVEPVTAKAEPAAAPAEKADAKTPEPAKSEPAKAEPKPAASDGCFASARPRSLIGSGVAFAFAVLAGLMLRRR